MCFQIDSNQIRWTQTTVYKLMRLTMAGYLTSAIIRNPNLYRLGDTQSILSHENQFFMFGHEDYPYAKQGIYVYKRLEDAEKVEVQMLSLVDIAIVECEVNSTDFLYHNETLPYKPAMATYTRVKLVSMTVKKGADRVERDNERKLTRALGLNSSPSVADAYISLPASMGGDCTNSNATTLSILKQRGEV
jgi:hypothetical protein